jgi:hypothetical protein
MATEKTTPPVNYLGHPCSVAALAARFPNPLEIARKEDSREAAQTLARGMSMLVDRIGHMHNVLTTLRPLVEGLDDADEVASLIALATDYELETSTRAFELSGSALMVIEHSGLATVAA